MAEKLLLYVHIFAAASSFLTGTYAICAEKSRGGHTMVGTIYHWLMLLACLTAVPLALLHWEKSRYLIFVAIGSYSFAFRGYRAARMRQPGWLGRHISGMLGSYIAMTTALVVIGARSFPILTAVPSFVFWILPTLVGTPLIILSRRRFKTARNA